MPERYLLEVRTSKIEGRGAFALEAIPARKKIGNLEGEIVSLHKARKKAASIKRVAIVEFGDGRALDATDHFSTLRFINHSCKPNTYMRVAYSKVEFYTLRSIAKDEELCCNYGETHHDGNLPCQCGTEECKGFI